LVVNCGGGGKVTLPFGSIREDGEVAVTSDGR
jgi:hypothetical protein